MTIADEEYAALGEDDLAGREAWLAKHRPDAYAWRSNVPGGWIGMRYDHQLTIHIGETEVIRPPRDWHALAMGRLDDNDRSLVYATACTMFIRELFTDWQEMMSGQWDQAAIDRWEQRAKHLMGGAINLRGAEELLAAVRALDGVIQSQPADSLAVFRNIHDALVKLGMPDAY